MNDNTITAETFVVGNNEGIMQRVEGLNEPAYTPAYLVITVLDKEGDVWVKAVESDTYYLPAEPYGETEDDADTSLLDIEQEYGIEDINVPAPEVACPCGCDDDPEEAEVMSTEPEPRYKRGDITLNRLTGREALILDAQYHALTGMVLYTVIEKGFVYTPGCSATKGAGTMPEFVLDPTEQPPFSEAETSLLTLVYSL